MKTETRQAVWGGVKLAACGAVIWSIGFAFLTLHPGYGGVEESSADVWDLTVFERSNTQKFAEALDRLGHEPPRVYRANGNELYFSSRVTRTPPEQLVHEYQREFVSQGLNDKTYGVPLPNAPKEVREKIGLERTEALLTGEIVPFSANPRYMMMGGGVMKGAPDTIKQLGAAMDEAHKGNMGYIADSLADVYRTCGGDPKVLAKFEREHLQEAEEVRQLDCAEGGPCSDDAQRELELRVRTKALRDAIKEQKSSISSCPAMQKTSRELAGEHGFDGWLKAFRSIEGFRDAESGTTGVTAVWSDEDLDLRTSLPMKYGPQQEAIDGDIPVCPGCLATWNYGGTDRERHLSTNLLLSRNGVGYVTDYYTRRLQEEGWKRTPSDQVMEFLYQRVGHPYAQARFISFQRGDEQVELLVKREGDRDLTTISVMKNAEALRGFAPP